MANEELIHIRWHVDRSREPNVFMLLSQEPEYAELSVSIGADEVTERVAKARLMEQMYNLAEEKGIPAKRLRFKINGIDE